ncbi:MAG: hypothetical protein WC866_00330 [Patescibacteria group bacterium]
MQEILQMIEALGIFLTALVTLLVFFPLWPLGIWAFIEWHCAPLLPDSAID